MLVTLRKRHLTVPNPSTPSESKFWLLADQILTSEGGITLLFLIPALVTFFVWSSLPAIK